MLLRVLSGLRDALARGIPIVSAETAAAFRILFTALVLAYLLRHPAQIPEQLPGDSDTSYAAIVVRWLGGTPAIGSHLNSILVGAALFVIAGAGTRVAYAIFLLAFLAWACLQTFNSSHHPISALAVLMIGLLPARWSDAWSVDAWIRLRRGRVAGAASRRYGYAPWLPGFVMGVAFAAAAWSKVGNGPDWILNGTIRYHFVTDLRDALVAWGPWLTSLPGVAVAGSFAAVAIETLLIVAAFLRGWKVRALLGVAALSLLAGFALFQGVIWAGWWILLLGFLPWALVTGSPAHRSTGEAIGPAQLIVIVLIAVQQLVVSADHIESRPLFSTYDMYSTTYDSPAQYEAKSNMVYRVIGVDATGVELPFEDCVISDNEAVGLVEALRQRPDDQESVGIVRECLTRQPAAVQIILEGDKRVYDWPTGQFQWKRRLSTFGPLQLPKGAPGLGAGVIDAPPDRGR